MHDKDLALAIRAAHSAGDLLLEFWSEREGLTISSKRAGDFVSEADTTAENHLREVLLAGQQDDNWLGEEGGAQGQGSRRWIVDPLDGTTNFLRGIPHWAVSIALEVDGELKVGVVHDPVHNETFAAQLGGGANAERSRDKALGHHRVWVCAVWNRSSFWHHGPHRGHHLADRSPHAALRWYSKDGLGSARSCIRCMRQARWLLGAKAAALGHCRRIAHTSRSRSRC